MRAWLSYKALAEQGWTQQQIAEAKGCSQALVSFRQHSAEFPVPVRDRFISTPYLNERHAQELIRLLAANNLSPWLTQEQAMLEIIDACESNPIARGWLEPCSEIGAGSPVSPTRAGSWCLYRHFQTQYKFALRARVYDTVTDFLRKMWDSSSRESAHIFRNFEPQRFTHTRSGEGGFVRRRTNSMRFAHARVRGWCVGALGPGENGAQTPNRGGGGLDRIHKLVYN